MQPKITELNSPKDIVQPNTEHHKQIAELSKVNASKATLSKDFVMQSSVKKEVKTRKNRTRKH